MTADPIDQVIQAIALKHGVAIGRDDPLVMVVTMLTTMQDNLATRSVDSQRALLDTFKTTMESVAHSWDVNAKDKAERILTAALATSKDAMAAAAKENAESVRSAVRAELEAASETLRAHAESVGRSARMALVAAFIALAGATLVAVTLVAR